MSGERVSYGVDWQTIDRCVGATSTPVHPGELLTDWMRASGVRQCELADALDMNDSYLSMIRSGAKNIGPSVALRLERETGVKAEIWLHLQMSYTLAQMREAEAMASLTDAVEQAVIAWMEHASREGWTS